MDQKQVCASVMRCLNRLRLTEAFCDITLLVGDVPIPAHKAVLAGTSNFFHSVLSLDPATDMLQINGMSAPDMVKVLDFLYTGQILVNKNNVGAIETMGEQLQISILTELCSTFRMQNQKKAPPTKKAPYTKGASRTRTYTRWGRQHTLRPGSSSGDEDSDNDEVTLLSEDHNRGSGQSNMDLSAPANSHRLQLEQNLFENIHRSNLKSPKRKSTPKMSRSKPNKRQRNNAAGAHKLTTLMTDGFLQGKTSVEPESLDLGTHCSQDPSLEAQNEVCPTSALTSHMDGTECVTSQTEGVDQNGESSSPMDTIMQEVCKVVDLSGVSVYRQHDLTVTSISDTQAGHVLISDTGMEADLGSLLDIQSLLSGYSASGQPIILTTCDDEPVAATNSDEQTHCSLDLVAEVDQTVDDSPSGAGEEGLMMVSQPVILTTCGVDDEEDATATKSAEQTMCEPSGTVEESLMMAGQPVILTTCAGEGEDTEDTVVGLAAGQPIIITCEGEGTVVDLVAAVGQSTDDPSGFDKESLTQDQMMDDQPIILTTCEKEDEGTETSETVVDLVAQINSQPVIITTCQEDEECTETDATVVDLMAGQPVILTTCEVQQNAARNYTEQDVNLVAETDGPVVGLVADVDDHNACSTVDVVPSGADQEGPDLMQPSPAPRQDSHCSSSSAISGSGREAAADNVQTLDMDMDSISNLPEAEPGFHDYCLSTDSIRVLQKSSASESEGQQSNKVDPTLEMENEDSSRIEVRENKESSHIDVNELNPAAWNATHVVIIQESDEEPDNTNKIQKQTITRKGSVCSQCPWCTARFTNAVQLRAHTKDSHPDSMYGCSFCTRTFVEEERRDIHMDWCRVGEKVDGRYRCPQCIYSAAKAIFVVNHYRIKHTTRCQRTCDRCHQVFNTHDDYYDHQLQVHQEDITEVCRRKVYVCSQCGFRTVKAYLLKSHMTGHSEERFPCQQCDKSFKTVLIQKRHEKFIHSSDLIHCSQCDFTSKYAATLKAHEYRVHDIKAAEQPVHHCHYCDYSHVDRSNLSKHERLKHSDERPFLCSFCPTSFKHKHQLTIHERTHMGLRPFQCPLCPYAARSKLALRTHHGYRHLDTKPYGCDLCGFHTKAASNLLSHKARCHKRHAAKLKSPTGTHRKKFSIALKSQPLVPS